MMGRVKMKEKIENNHKSQHSGGLAEKLKPIDITSSTANQKTTFSQPSTSGQSISRQIPKIKIEQSIEKQPKKKSKIRLFVERVTIAGLLESYESHIKADRYMFRLALILSIVGIGFSAAICAAKYLNRGSALGGLEVTGIQAPFPNVTVCSPESSKREILRQWVVDYGNATKLKEKSRLTLEEIVEKLASVASYNIRYKTFEKAPKMILLEMIDNLLNKLKLGLAGLFPLLYPTCSEMFSKCMFGTHAFNCCDATELTILDGTTCFQFSVTRLSEIKTTAEIEGGQSNDAIKMDSSGLSLDVRIDWPNVIFWDDVASDGFNVFVGPLPSPFSTNPVAIPSDMDATIVLKPPKLVSELEGCLSRDHLPLMPHGRCYDPDAVSCIAEEMEKHVINFVGCAIPMLNFVLDNKTECNIRQTIVFAHIFNGDFITELKGASEDKGMLTALAKATLKKDRMRIKIGRSALRKCLPFCTRYIYDVLSASYASLHRRGEIGWSDNKRENQSWSRIRVFFPQASYTIHKEDYLNPTYMAVCEIGGIVGVYFGASMVTLMQIVAYAILICVSLMKRNRIRPA